MIDLISIRLDLPMTLHVGFGLLVEAVLDFSVTWDTSIHITTFDASIESAPRTSKPLLKKFKADDLFPMAIQGCASGYQIACIHEAEMTDSHIQNRGCGCMALLDPRVNRRAI